MNGQDACQQLPIQVPSGRKLALRALPGDCMHCGTHRPKKTLCGLTCSSPSD